MSEWGKRGWGATLIVCFAGACGQELVLPEQKPRPMSAVDAPSEGFTGAGGMPDEPATSARLPVEEQPIFTAFGGAGGDATNGAAGQGHAEGSAVSSSPKGGAGGVTGSGGTGSTTGGKPSGGAGVTGGGGNAGVANAGAGSLPGGPPTLLFSEYVEGSGSFKALEIYALEASSLEGCELQTYFNGKLEPSGLALHGQLARGDVYVLCTSALATAQPGACDRSTSLTFNGDDALALSCDDVLLDVIGQIGVDPGESWGAGATLDHTLRRRCDVIAGRRDGNTPFEVDPEWLTLGKDTFLDLGVRSCEP